MRTQVMIPRTMAWPGLTSLNCLLPLFPTPNAPKNAVHLWLSMHQPPSNHTIFLFFPPFPKEFSSPFISYTSNSSIDKGRGNSIAAAILPPSPPALIPLRTVKLGLPQLPVDVVVSPAQPLRKLVSAVHLRLLPRHVALEVLSAYPARVQLREEPDKAQQVRLLSLRGQFWVRRRDGVEERPGAPAKGLDVGRAVGRRARGDDCCTRRYCSATGGDVFFRLCGPGSK